MRVGVVLPVFSRDPGRVVESARRAEDLGFEGVFSFDHLYPLGGPPDGPALEAFSILSAVAAATERVRVGTLVTRATLRPPGLIAKLAASVHGISGGRLVLAMGSGDHVSRGEHERYGLEYLEPPERGEQLAEAVQAVTALLRGRPYRGGRRIGPVEGPILPPPVAPGPPVWVGGTSRHAIRIAARFADGWNGWGLDPEGFATRVAALGEAAGEREVEPTWADAVVVGRDEAEAERLRDERRGSGRSELWTGSAERMAARLAEVRRAGATWAILLPAGGAGRLEAIAEGVLPAVRRG